MEVRRLMSNDELERAFPLMRELRTHLTEDTFFDLLDEMTREGYELWGLSEDGNVTALAGIAFRTNFYYGRYVWVFDLVTTSHARSQGHGATLLKHLEDMATRRGCDTVALSSGLERLEAHRFYEDKMGYEKASYAFKKRLR